jgi:hypothetical protein
MENSEKELIRTRIKEELNQLLASGGIKADLITEGIQDFVIYYALEASGGSVSLPDTTSVVVTVPQGYPATQPDMPALPSNSPLIPHVVGGSNPQGIVSVLGQQWRLLSYHPYNGQDGPTWNPNKHGFHDYYQHLYAWLHKLK